MCVCVWMYIYLYAEILKTKLFKNQKYFWHYNGGMKGKRTGDLDRVLHLLK